MPDDSALVQRLTNLSADRRELLRKLIASKGRRPIPRRDPWQRVPLTFGQQRLWIIDQLLDGKTAYSETNLIRLMLPLDADAFRRAMNEIVRRHEILRTTIHAGDGDPYQLVLESLAIEIPVVDLRGEPPAERERAAQELIGAAWLVPFDLETGPLIRGTLYRLDAADYLFALTLHHLVCDGWSMGVLAAELSCLYWSFTLGRPSPLPEPATQYGDFAVWQRKTLNDHVLAPQLQYWRTQLADLPVLDLPTDRPRPAQFTYQGSRAPIVIGQPLFGALASLAERHDVTLQMVLATALFVLLHKYSGREDFAIGSPVSGRGRKELEPLIGFFVNMLVLRVDLSGSPTFLELLQRVRQVSVAAYGNGDVPFERLVEELRVPRDPSRNPLVQVVLQLFQPPGVPGIEREHVFPFTPAPAGGSKFDLHFELLWQPDEIRGFVEYNTDLFDAGRIARMVSHLHVLLRGVADDPRRAVSSLDVLTDEERRTLVTEWNKTTAAYPRDASIPEIVAAHAAAQPDAVALEFASTLVSYAALKARADGLAVRLASAGIEPGDRVALLLERCLDLPVAMLGILAAGAIYVPLDPRYPLERLSYLLSDSGAKAVVTSTDLEHTIDVLGYQRILMNDVTPAPHGSHVAVPAQATDVAYLLYTSGTTGKPKGVPLTHRNAVRLVKAPSLVPISAADTMLHFAPITFDASVFEIWGALLNGARLVIHPPGMPSLAELAAFIERAKISLLFLTTGLFTPLVEHHASQLRGVRELVTGGEALSIDAARAAWHHLPRTRIVNAYGPTECGTIATAYCLSGPEDFDRAVPIGRPIENTTVYVVDQHGLPVPIGVPGEICIGGDAVAPGYWHRPELTSRAFVPDRLSGAAAGTLYRTGDVGRYRADGHIEFLGRRDRQVKVSGHRIELDEIEAALVAHPDVSVAAVVAVGSGESARLEAFAEPVPGCTADAGGLRRYLEAALPRYMVPSRLEVLERLPRTASGKLDLLALQRQAGQPAGLREESEAPRTPLERVLASLWCDILLVERPGLTDDFFELGGQSLVATRLLTRIHDTLAISVTMRDFFADPTIRGLAAVIGKDPQAVTRADWLAVVPSTAAH